MVTIPLSAIKKVIDAGSPDQLMKIMEEGFVLLAQKLVKVPPVGHLGFENPPGDVHIKYGYIEGDEFYVIKIASGFYDNPKQGLPPGNGMMLLFSQKTGMPLSFLLDEGYLTDIRTAVAGAVAAKYLAPSRVNGIGIVGTGVQARLQLKYLKSVTNCRDVVVWGRGLDKVESFMQDPELREFSITGTTDIHQLTGGCNLIVTCTASRKPLLSTDMIRPGTHITAMGADAAGKQEIDQALVAKADIVVADSKEQCIDHGDIGFAVRNSMISPEKITTLGEVIQKPGLRRLNDQQISIADLTGVAIQDIQITKYVYLNHQID